MPHFTIDWKLNGKIHDKQIKQILSNRIFSSLKVIIVTDEMKDFQGYSSLSYIGSNGQIIVSSLSIPFHILQLKGLNDLLSLVYDTLKKTITVSIILEKPEIPV